MLKQLLKDSGIEVSDQELNEILKITTDDVRENRIKFGKRTNLNEVFTIAFRTYKVMERTVVS